MCFLHIAWDYIEWKRNKTKLLQCNTQPNHPVAKLKAIDNGRHAQKADINKAGGLIPLLYLCRDGKVMLVVNLKAEWGLYNGAVDTVVNIVYKDGCRPTDDPAPLPDVVFVRFAGYKSPPLQKMHKMLFLKGAALLLPW